MRHPARLLAAGVLFLLPVDASSQRVLSSLDISGTAIRYADSVNASGASVSPAFRVDWSHATLSASADISALAGKSSLQGTVAPSVFTPSFGSTFAEVAGAFGGSTHEDGTHTGQMLAVARAYYSPVPTGGVWIGGGAGQTWDGVAWRQLAQGEVGGWIDQSGVTTLLTLTPVRIADGVRYNDFEVAIRYPGRIVELGASLGARSGGSGPVLGENQRVWGTVSALRWMSSRIALVASAGSYPVDLTQGFPGGRFATVAVRVASPKTKPAPTAAASNEAAPVTAHDAVVQRFRVHTETGNRRVIDVDAQWASRVEISGDFTQWRPVALARGPDGRWTMTLPIPHGTYQVVVRVNGGAWLAPPGLLTSRDEFGVVVGILSIE